MHSKKFAWIVAISMLVLLCGVCPAMAGTATLNWTANEESDLNEYRIYFGESSRNYGPYIPVSSGTQYSVEGLEAGKTYYFAVTAVDTSGNESGFSAEVSKAIASAGDTVAPDIQILQPTDAEFFFAQSSTITISGSASDNVGVTAVSWRTDAGTSGQASGTTAWEIPDLSLSAEQTTVTVAATDEAGNRTESSILISYSDSRSAFSVSQVQAANGKAYTVETNLTNGEKGFIDRNDKYAGVPAELIGSHYIRTAREDTTYDGDNFLRFSVSEDATVYVAYHNVIDGRPSWMSGFSDTSVDLALKGRKTNEMSLYRKDFPAGEIVLGGNGSPKSTAYMYTVIVKPASETQLALDSGAEPPSPDPPPVEPPIDEEPLSGDFTVKDVVASSGKSYLSLTGLKDGDRGFMDRNDVYSEVPAELIGSHYIRTAREDTTYDGDNFLRFSVSEDATVYVAYHNVIDGRPSWMSGFSDTSVDLALKGRKTNEMSLYRKNFPAGEIVLGGNGSPKSTAYMYTVIVKPASETQLALDSGAEPPSPDPPPVEPPIDEEPLSGDFTVKDVVASSGKSYLSLTGLKDGDRGFMDRNDVYSEVPAELIGSHYIRTAREDTTYDGDNFLRFSVSEDATVYVAYHNVIDDRPLWMSGFSDTGVDLALKGRKTNEMSLYRKDFPAGEIVLGGNGSPKSTAYMYTVIVKPAAGG